MIKKLRAWLHDKLFWGYRCDGCGAPIGMDQKVLTIERRQFCRAACMGPDH